MPQATIRPNATTANPTINADWDSVTATVIGDGNIATYINATAAARDTSWTLPNQAWAADSQINFVGVYMTARYTGPSSLVWGGMPAPAIAVAAIIDSGGYNYVIANSVMNTSLAKDTWNHYIIGTATEKSPGVPFTKADIDNLLLFVQSTAYPSGYSLQVAEVWVVVDYNQPSVPTATAPNATVVIPSPDFVFTHTDPDGESASAYRARIFKWSDIAAYDNSWNAFNDAGTPYHYDSGVVPVNVSTGNSITVTPPTPLDNHTEYRCYLQVLTNGVWSQPIKTTHYAYAVTKFPEPSAPRISNVVVDDGDNNILAIFEQRENLANNDQADQVTGLADWTAKSNCSISRYTTAGGVAKYDGVVGPAIDVLSSASGDFELGLNDTTTPPFDVTLFDEWSATIKVVPVGFAGGAGTETARRVRVDIKWFTSANVLVSQTIGAESRTVISEWVTAHITAKKPATATKAAVRIRFLGATAASERHFLSSFQFKAGPVNLCRDPLLRIDTNGNGLADHLTSYRWPSSGTVATYSQDSSPPAEAVVSHDLLQKIAIPVGNADGWVGFYETYRLALGRAYTMHMWVYSDAALQVDEYIDTVYPSLLWPAQVIPANTLTHVERTFVMRDSNSLATAYHRFAPQGGGAFGATAVNIWVSAIMMEPTMVEATLPISNAFGGFESGIGTFINVSNAQLNQQTPQAAQDANSLRIRSIAAGDVTFAATATGTNGYPVTPGGKAYCAVNASAAVTSRSLEMYAFWYQAGGAASAVLASQLIDTSHENEASGAGYMTLGAAVFDVPSDAAYCQIRIVVKATAAANEAHYFDVFQFIGGDPTIGIFNPEHYAAGGYSGGRYLEVQKSQADGSWEPVVTMPGFEDGVWSYSFINAGMYDNFQEPGQEVWYRMRMNALGPTGYYAYSVWSPIVRDLMLAPLTRSWLKSLTDQDQNMIINLSDRKIPFNVQKQRATHMPLGRTEPMVVSGRRRSMSFPFKILCLTQEEYEGVLALLDADNTMMLQMPKRSMWVSLAGDYTEEQYVKNAEPDTEDTVIVGTFQQVSAPI